MKKALTFLSFIKFTGMDLGGRNDVNGFFVNDPSPFFWF
jgi:hypothetical protein